MFYSLTTELETLCRENRCLKDVAKIASYEYFLNFPAREAVLGLVDDYLPLYKKFFDFVSLNLQRGNKYFFAEYQYPEGVSHSGIMLDFDPYLATADPRLGPCLAGDIIRSFTADLIRTLNIDKFSTFAVVIAKESLQETEKTIAGETRKVFKEGFHILFPGIQVSKPVKNYLINNFIKPANNILEKQKYIKEIPGFDEACRYVNVEIYGSIRREKKTYSRVKYIFEVEIADGDFCVRDLDVSKFEGVNFCLELSLLYEGNLIQKKCFTEKSTICTELIQAVSIAPSRDKEKDRINKDIRHLSEMDFIASDLIRYINVLDINRGRQDSSGFSSSWKLICRYIAKVNLDYKPIAISFSVKCDEENWFKKGSDELNKIWDEVKLTNPTHEEKSRALCCIMKLAKEDNSALYEDYYKSSLNGKIYSLIKAIPSKITETDLAQIVASVYTARFYFVPEENVKCSSITTGFWLIYITEKTILENKRYEPFIWKYYKTSNFPKELDHLISIEFPNEFVKIIEFFNKNIEEKDVKEEKPEILALNKRINKIQLALEFCKTCSGIQKIAERLRAQFFNSTNILFEINPKSSSTLGTGNGILVFDKEVKFYTDDSPFKITKTTRTRYIPYNEEDCRELEQMLSEIFPNELEKKCILMSLAQSLVRNASSRYMQFWYSPGSSGKSLICYLMHNVLGIRADSTWGKEYGYSFKVDPGIFMKDKIDPNGADNHLSNLGDMMFISASEGATGDIKGHLFKRLRDASPYRKNFGETQIIDFPGIIVIPLNHEFSMEKYDYGFGRRILFYRFMMKFVSSKEAAEKKNDRFVKVKNEVFLARAQHDEKLAENFLSILVKMWSELQRDYEGDLDKIMDESGVMKQTTDFILRHDHLSVFITECVEICEGSRIPFNDMCVKYADWLSKGLKKNFRSQDFISSITQSSLDQYLRNDTKSQYFEGIKFKDKISDETFTYIKN